MMNHTQDSLALAEVITKSASKQTYYTIRLLADQGMAGGAYRAYGYFRWVDDVLDGDEWGSSNWTQEEKLSFVRSQKDLVDACYRDETMANLCPEEYMLVDLVKHDTGKNPGLRSYLYNMMAVMEFDAARRGQIISQAELDHYTQMLAVAVTDALHYFIGHYDPQPDRELRYQAVTAAHMTHMLRDAYEDTEIGYFNIPSQFLKQNKLNPQDIEASVYRDWVCERVKLARQHFLSGRKAIAQVKSWRCRLAGYAYTARFEWVLRTIERENFCLRCEYPDRKGWRASLWMVWNTLKSVFVLPLFNPQSAQPQRVNE
jgi:phytoene/squalene synthetase